MPVASHITAYSLFSLEVTTIVQCMYYTSETGIT